MLFERKDWICVCGKVFLERLSFQDLRAKCTTAYEEWIYQQVAKQDISAVAVQEGLSWNIVEGIFLKGRQKQAGAFTQSRRGVEPNLAY